MPEVIVVGGGVAGAAAAYHLARGGAQVTLLERDVLAAHASGRNMGLLLNQTEPGVVRMMQAALRHYDALAEGPVRFGLRRLPQIMVAATPEQAAGAQTRAAQLAATGLQVSALDPAALRREQPFLGPAVAGGFVIGDAVLLEPGPATFALAEAARAAGARIETATRVIQVALSGGKVAGVISDRGRTACDAVVLAGGPWLGDLDRRLPLLAGRGWLLRTGRLPFRLDAVIEEMSWPDQDQLGRASRAPSLADVASGHDRPLASAFVISPLETGDALVGTSLSPSLRDSYEGLDMPRQIAARAIAAAPGLTDVPVAASWFGLRPMTPDGMPVVGAGAADGIYLHGGHGSIGMMTAPATGEWLADLMLTGRRAPELDELEPARFL